MQNRDGTFPVHVLGHTWHWHLYWVLVAGLGIALVGVLGVALMRAVAAYARRLRRETAKLLAERAALSGHLPDPDSSPFFAGDTRPGKRHWFRRGHHAV